jgi:hypothetical protein
LRWIHKCGILLEIDGVKYGDSKMALRKQFSGNVQADAELTSLIEASKKVPVTDEMLREQRISYAYGNAMNADRITKDSVRATSQSIRLIA